MSRQFYVTRREVFSAAHRLHSKDYTDEENVEIFGKCNNPNGHGHNYILEVVVKGELIKETGYVIDLKILKNIIREHVIKKVDHKHLNNDVEFLQGVNPTAENIVVVSWNKLRKHLDQDLELELTLYETPRNFVSYKGH